jgi:DNA-binding MarR family transcriptional regulator
MEALAGESASGDAEQSLGRLLKRAEQTLLRAKSAAVKPVGLTLPQYVALAELERRPGITGAQLARACLVSPQAMMVVLRSSEEQGLVERRLHARHQTVLEVYLTDAGREALASARTRVEPVERRITDALSSEEIATLRVLLARCIEATQGP